MMSHEEHQRMHHGMLEIGAGAGVEVIRQAAGLKPHHLHGLARVGQLGVGGAIAAAPIIAATAAAALPVVAVGLAGAAIGGGVFYGATKLWNWASRK